MEGPRHRCDKAETVVEDRSDDLGLDESVEILRTRHRDEQLRTGDIVAADRSWFCTPYFDATGTELLACSGAKNGRSARRDAQKLQL